MYYLTVMDGGGEYMGNLDFLFHRLGSRRSRVVVFVQEGNGVFDLINAGHDQYSHVLAGLGQQV